MDLGSERSLEDLQAMAALRDYSIHESPEVGENEIIVWSCQCPFNCELAESESFACSKNLQCLGYFESIPKAKERIHNHAKSNHWKTIAEVDEEIDLKDDSCIRGQIWDKADWSSHVTKLRADQEKKKQHAKTKAAERAAERAAAAEEEPHGPVRGGGRSNREGPYVKRGPTSAAPPAPRRPPSPAGRPPAPASRPSAHRPSSSAAGSAMSALTDALHGNQQVIQLEELPPEMTSKNVLLEYLTRAASGLRAIERVARFTVDAFTEEAQNMEQASLSFATHICIHLSPF